MRSFITSLEVREGGERKWGREAWGGSLFFWKRGRPSGAHRHHIVECGVFLARNCSAVVESLGGEAVARGVVLLAQLLVQRPSESDKVDLDLDAPPARVFPGHFPRFLLGRAGRGGGASAARNPGRGAGARAAGRAHSNAKKQNAAVRAGGAPRRPAPPAPPRARLQQRHDGVDARLVPQPRQVAETVGKSAPATFPTYHARGPKQWRLRQGA